MKNSIKVFLIIMIAGLLSSCGNVVFQLSNLSDDGLQYVHLTTDKYPDSKEFTYMAPHSDEEWDTDKTDNLTIEYTVENSQNGVQEQKLTFDTKALIFFFRKEEIFVSYDPVNGWKVR